MRPILSEDIPQGSGTHYTDRELYHMLPAALSGDYEIRSFEPVLAAAGKDPVVLRDQWGHIVHQWPDGYMPDWVDVLKVCQELSLI